LLRNIWKTRELLYCLVRRDLIVRYQSSILGFFWSFAKPLALVLIFQVAFQFILRVDKPNPGTPFGFHLLVGILVWGFFSRSIAEGNWSVLSHANLIKKVKLPVEVFPAVTLSGNLINFLLAMLIVYPILLISLPAGSDITWWMQLLLFVLLTILLALLTFAFTVIVSALNVFFRDVESLMEVLLQAWFYATPIVYPVSLLYQKEVFTHGRWGQWLEIAYWLNPMAAICAAYRRVLLYHPTGDATLIFSGLEIPDAQLVMYLGLSCGVTLIVYLAATAVFRHYAPLFADEV
jgi:lipopolysaccharide transport system permease protein